MAKKAKAVGWWAVYSEQVDAGKSKSEAAKIANDVVKGKAIPADVVPEQAPKSKPKKESKPAPPIKPKPKGKG